MWLRHATVAPTLLLVATTCTSRSPDAEGRLLMLSSGLLASSADPSALVTGSPASNIARLQYDFLWAGDYPITACDINNSSGSGIVVNTAAAPLGGTLLINPVPATSPFTFAAGSAQLDLDGYGVHIPDGEVVCTLSRSSNTATRYTATLSPGCTLNGMHTIQQLELDCTPN